MFNMAFFKIVAGVTVGIAAYFIAKPYVPFLR